ncbi:hypothetical protein D3C71_1436850 [compost metagenome]
MSVSSAEVRQPAPLATATMLLASSSEASKVGMKAPEPTFTSITRASSPEASFLERMEPVIMAMDSTVAVMSRTA